jgi:EAL domain-containing protein (putative c-di-GMP-specific phosphodiesterase class I)
MALGNVAQVYPRFQKIVDVIGSSVIGYESTIRGCRGESAQMLFERSSKHGTLQQLDRIARWKAVEQGIPLLQLNQLLFINVSTFSLFHGELEFPEHTPLNRIVLEVVEQMPLNR